MDTMELNLNELAAANGGVLDEERKKYLLSFIRLIKDQRLSKERCLELSKGMLTEEELAFVAENW